ncbi:MAG: hypothetical protein GY750_21160 [Lentisphaerae bacterium]|nr:hypothetical protein [Lentisphaerota bacterium]
MPIFNMKEPDKEKTKQLLGKHSKGVPNWTTKEKQDVYEQLKRLYGHWYRREI